MENNELMHYGVLGMKWGVKKARKAALHANTTKKYESAVNSLDSHRAKSVKKLGELEKRTPKLEKKAQRAIEKTDVKAAGLNKRAAKHERRSKRFLFTTDIGIAYNSRKAARLYNRAASLEKYSAKAKSKLAKNKRLIEVFSKGIEDIDKTKIEVGKRYLELLDKESQAVS